MAHHQHRNGNHMPDCLYSDGSLCSFKPNEIYSNFGSWNLHDGFADSNSINNHLNEMYQNQNNSGEFAPQVLEWVNKFKQENPLDPQKGFNIELFRSMLPKGFVGPRFGMNSEYLSDIFWRYYLDQEFCRLPENSGVEKFRSERGVPPWEILNEMFETAGFPLRCTSPLGLAFYDRFIVRFYHVSRPEQRIPISALSSGEKIIVTIFIWVFNRIQDMPFPKLLLLDEPDAHLHPTFVKTFLDFLHVFLVKKHGIQVIMSTHSPTTVALAPADVIYVVNRYPTSVERAQDKSAVVSQLSAGLITVLPSTRYVFVEDQDDVNFYNAALESFKRLRKKLEQSLVFIPVSYGRGISRETGGCSKIIQWIEKTSCTGLAGVIVGLIDKDEGNVPSDNLLVLDRYSIENYLLDPLVVYRAILDCSDSKVAQAFSEIGLRQGEEGRIASLDQPTLQRVVDILERLVTPYGNVPCGLPRREVKYSNGLIITVPAWMLDAKGKEIMSHYNSKFQKVDITVPNLMKNFERLDILPEDLNAKLSQCFNRPS